MCERKRGRVECLPDDAPNCAPSFACNSFCRTPPSIQSPRQQTHAPTTCTACLFPADAAAVVLLLCIAAALPAWVCAVLAPATPRWLCQPTRPTHSVTAWTRLVGLRGSSDRLAGWLLLLRWCYLTVVLYTHTHTLNTPPPPHTWRRTCLAACPYV